MSTGFVSLSTETFRWHHCTGQSDAFHPWFWNSYTDSFSRVWKVQLLITPDNIIPVLASIVLLLRGQVEDIRPKQTSDVVLSVWWRHWPEILRRNPKLKPQHIASVLPVLCNCMQYSATWDVFIVQNTQSYETSWFSAKVTAVTLVNTVVLDLGMGLGLSKSNAIFVYSVRHNLKYKNTL